MSKHTPGPWVAAQCLDESCHVYCVDGVLIPSIRGSNPIQQLANARLVSAAPDLLAVLVEAVDSGIVPISSAAEGGAARHSRQVHAADKIRAAIAKATGESQ